MRVFGREEGVMLEKDRAQVQPRTSKAFHLPSVRVMTQALESSRS